MDIEEASASYLNCHTPEIITSEGQDYEYDIQSTVSSGSNASLSLPYKKRKCSSQVYNYFTYNGSACTFACTMCGKIYRKSKDGTTSSMLRHVRSTHKLLTGTTTKCVTDELMSFAQDGLNDRVVKFIIVKDQPFNVTEDDHFLDIIRYLRPNTNLPSRNSITRYVHDLYDKEMNVLKVKLKMVPGKLAFVVDCWTSSNQHPFQGVIVQWITESWQLYTIALDLTFLEGSHSGKNLVAAFADVLTQFEIPASKIVAVTTDNASNMDTFFSSFKHNPVLKDLKAPQSQYRVRCLAHVLNLICQTIIDAFDEEDKNIHYSDNDSSGEESDNGKLPNNCKHKPVETLRKTCKKTYGRAGVKPVGILGRLRKAIISVRSSPQRRQLYKRQCEVYEIDYRELIRDIKIRWNSTLNMLKRAVQMRQVMS